MHAHAPFVRTLYALTMEATEQRPPFSSSTALMRHWLGLRPAAAAGGQPSKRPRPSARSEVDAHHEMADVVVSYVVDRVVVQQDTEAARLLARLAKTDASFAAAVREAIRGIAAAFGGDAAGDPTKAVCVCEPGANCSFGPAEPHASDEFERRRAELLGKSDHLCVLFANRPVPDRHSGERRSPGAPGRRPWLGHGRRGRVRRADVSGGTAAVARSGLAPVAPEAEHGLHC